VPTRQTSSSGRPKSPRIQVVMPEDLCQRLALLAEDESRTVSNMAKVLIQQGVERLELLRLQNGATAAASGEGASPAPPSPIPAFSPPSPGLPAPAATHPAALAQPPTASEPTVPPANVAPPTSAPAPSTPPATSGSGLDDSGSGPVPGSDAAADRFRAELERNEAQGPRRLRGVPRRLRLRPPGG
jgi:predicted DNA-binding protein